MGYACTCGDASLCHVPCLGRHTWHRYTTSRCRYLQYRRDGSAAQFFVIRFRERPRIVDSRPITFQTWSRTPSGDAVLVYFTTGTPQCHGVHATVHETDDAIEIALRGGTPPDAVGKMCTMIAVQGSLLVPLENPLAERRVLSVV